MIPKGLLSRLLRCRLLWYLNRKALKAQRGVSKASAGKQSTSREILGLTRFDQASSPVNLFGADVNLAAVGLR